MFESLPIGAQGLSAAISARVEPLTVALNDDEFAVYVCALRNFWRIAAVDAAEYHVRMHALDLLRAVKAQLCADSVDTAHLRACWESRQHAATWGKTYDIVLHGRSVQTTIYALAEYGASEPEDRAGETFRVVAKALRERIDGMVR